MKQKRVQMVFIRYFISLTLLTPIFVHAHPSALHRHIINDSTLQAIENEVRNDDFGRVSGVVVMNAQGKMLYEQYFRFNDKNTLHQISSVSKSITSLLFGICLKAGYIKSLDTPVHTYFPEYDDYVMRNPIKQQITIDHLLKQSSGLRWEEWKYPYNYASNSLIASIESGRNWVEQFFQLPADTLPGTKFSYNSLATQVLAEILHKATGTPFDELVVKMLFKPLNINNYHWDSYPNNSYPAWGGLSLTTADMAKLGLLIINKGRLCGTQIVDSSWIITSTKQYTTYNDSIGYAMHWWIDSRNGTTNTYAAGYGDQYVYIDRARGIVVAVNAQNFSDYRWPKTMSSLLYRLANSIEMKR